MKSRITIDIDHTNSPVIKIEYAYSNDVRDKMVKRFLEKFGGESSWAKMVYDINQPLHQDPLSTEGISAIATITPICNYDIPEESAVMAEQARLHLKMRNFIHKEDYADPIG